MPTREQHPCIRVGLDLSCLLARPWTGVGYYTYHLICALLQREGIEVHVFAGAARPDAAQLGEVRTRAASVRVVRFPTRLRALLWQHAAWPPLERFTGPVDIAHGAFHMLPPARAAKRVVTVFDLTAFLHPETRPAQNAALHRRLLRHAVSHADLVVVLSESVRQEVIEQFGIAPDRVAVVPGGVRVKEFDVPIERIESARVRYGIPDDYFVHIGTLEPRKNLVRLIEAHARVRGTCPPLVLVGGRGWMDAPILEAIARQAPRRVLPLGYISREHAVALLRGARACLYPSRYEGFGLPVLEAMAAGTPVLTSRVSAMPEVAGDTALLVDPTDTDALAAGIQTLLDNPDAAQTRARAAMERAHSFTWERAAAALAEGYRATIRPME